MDAATPTEGDEHMGRIVVTEFVSLDGVMEAPGGEEFKYPGWSFESDRGEEGNQFKLEETRASDALLLGRITYEGFAKASSRTSSTPCRSTSSRQRSKIPAGTTRRC